MRFEAADDSVTESELERQLCDIWREVLGITELKADDDFFEIGGHSLSASQIISRISQDLGADLALSTFFTHPTVSEQAQFLLYGESGGDSAARL